MSAPPVDPSPALEEARGGVRIRIHARPRARRSEIVGLRGDALKLSVKAPPVDGKANEAIRRFLADALGVGRGAVSLVRGETSRAKTFLVEGLGFEEARRRLSDAG